MTVLDVGSWCAPAARLGERMVWDLGCCESRTDDRAPAADDSAAAGRQNCRQNASRLFSCPVMAQCYMRCPSSADEWIMVEMQGELTSHEHTSFQNLTLGTLRVQDDVRTESIQYCHGSATATSQPKIKLTRLFLILCFNTGRPAS